MSKKLFIPFITAGDPDLDTTLQILHEMERAGADIIEIGIPFSDPMAEGPVIQAADERALASGTTTDRIFDMVADFRKTSQLPLVFMTYVNPVFVYGLDAFAQKCEAHNIQGIIIPDVPFEEKNLLSDTFSAHGVKVISMIAPTSKKRIHTIAAQAEGFLYCVSSLGVTGIRNQIGNAAIEMVQEAKKVTNIPCAIGFGISTPEQAHEMAKISDGVIVGSAIVRIAAKYGVQSPSHIYEYVKSMCVAITDC